MIGLSIFFYKNSLGDRYLNGATGMFLNIMKSRMDPRQIQARRSVTRTFFITSRPETTETYHFIR